MILRKIAEALRAQSWLTVILEVLIVVVGIFIGLQADSWNESRIDRAKERAYLYRLEGDVGRDTELLSQSIRESRQWLDGIVFAWRTIEDPTLLDESPCQFVAGIQSASFSFFPVLHDHTFAEIVSSGHLSLVRSPELKDELSRYYTEHESAGQWMESYRQLNVDYGTLFAGVLSRHQLQALNRYTDENICEITAEEARDARQKFMDRDGLVDWLPRLEMRQDSLSRRLQTSYEHAQRLSMLISAELR